MKALAVSLLGWMLVPLVALAQQPAADLNTITSITVNGGTVEITGSKKPDFNSFTMTDPPRLVLDVSGAVFQGVDEEQPVGNGTVTGIRTATYGTESASIARILIGYEREVETDIQSAGNKLVVKVLGGGGNTAVAANTPAQPQGTAEIASATNTPTGANAQDAAKAAASDRDAQDKAAKAAADAARADREAQEKAAAEASARAKADADAERQKQEEARLASQRQDEERRTSEAAAIAERKRQEEDARVAAQRAEEERRTAAQAAAEAQRQQQAQAQASAKSSAEEKRAAAQAAAEEKRAAAQAAAEEKRATAQAAADAKRQRAEEAQAATQARREEQQQARASAAETRRQKAEEARESRQQRTVASRETPSRAASQGSSARESGGGQTSSRRKTMTLVGFQQQPDSSRVFVRTNEPVRYTVSESGNQVVLELENTRVVESNNTLPLDTHFFPSAVSRVEAFAGAGHTVRVVIQLKQGVRYQTRQDGGLITLDFPRPGR
ncbi:AMIN domain-containing protein [Corallococcus sp. CA047B]|uniref:AMIN domain-containing protein n=1 Tax=Corallococcus sp. CA047B TaxID=2316729 RepID=UPI000EA0EAAC|nr:AMIN domain-containing protein [Corallococcus sp. CA047B]RKH19497.1 AMIN domain-containing protein [Corallococcus sp. CA047B]